MLAAATLKLRASLPASLREQAGRLAERFYLDAPGWYRRAEDVPYLPVVAAAVWDRRLIEITYLRWQEPAEVNRRLAPHGLVLKAGTWYVVARSNAVMRTYRVDQIVAAAPCDSFFAAEPGFDLAGYWRSYLAEFHRQLYTGHAVIRLSAVGVRRMRHLLSAAAVVAVETTGIADASGWVRARVPIESADLAVAEFLRLGADIEILEPAELRAHAARTIKAMAAIYG